MKRPKILGATGTCSNVNRSQNGVIKSTHFYIRTKNGSQPQEAVADKMLLYNVSNLSYPTPAQEQDLDGCMQKKTS